MQLELHKEYTIKGLKETDITSKLIAMGVLPGSKLKVLRAAPLGGVYFVMIDQVRFAMRENELSALMLDNE